MSNDVYIAGVGMTRFTVHLDKTYHELAGTALSEAYEDSKLSREDIQTVAFSNSLWGHFEEQHCIRGQCVLRPHGFLGTPIINVENACASASTGLFTAYMMIKSGEFDVALALGVEKIAHPEKAKSFAAYTGGLDRRTMDDTMNLYGELAKKHEAPMGEDDGLGKSVAMETYAAMARWHMWKYGSTQEDFARIAVKNRFNGSMNPKAHWQKPVTLEEVLSDREVGYPLTRSMCSPIGDGAAAAILVSERYLNKLKDARPVKIRTMVHMSGSDRRDFDEGEPVGAKVSKAAYEKAGLGPEDIDVAEIHDATAVGEMLQTEFLGFAPPGESPKFLKSGRSALDGDLPLNPSGGLLSRGHPIGASGIAQIHELVMQIRGEAGKRQVPKKVRIAMAENGGGVITIEEASMTITILEKP